MKQILVVLLFLNLACGENCTDLKTGTFELKSQDGSIHTIIRKKDIQIEKLGETGRALQYDVKWTSECEYMLTNRKLINGSEDNIIHRDTGYYKIVEIKGSTHKVTSKINGIDETFEAYLTKIK